MIASYDSDSAGKKKYEPNHEKHQHLFLVSKLFFCKLFCMTHMICTRFEFQIKEALL